MASKGPNNYEENFCNEHWVDYRHCVPTSDGMVKDYCKASCNNCGKILSISFSLFDYFQYSSILPLPTIPICLYF